MAGTEAGGKKAAARNRELYGADFYAKIGAKGGKLGTTGGFAANKELARKAGAKGGRISRRSKAAVAHNAAVATTQTSTDNNATTADRKTSVTVKTDA